MDLFENIDLVGIAALLSSLYVVYKFIRTRKTDEASQDASTSKDYADTAKIANERSRASDARADAMGDRVVILEDTIERLRNLIREEADDKNTLLALLSVWAKGITLLLYQISATGMTAVWTPRVEDIKTYLKEGGV